MKALRNNKTLSLFLLLFLFSSCSKPSPWHENYIISHNNSFSLIYRTPQNYLEIELLYFDETLSCFLNVPPAELSSNNKDIAIILSTAVGTLPITGYIREGRQKIALPENGKNFIINALTQNQTVKINIADIEEEISPENFSQKYKKLLNSNSFYSNLKEHFFYF